MITLTREEAKAVLDALEEAQSYTSCETWSPSMTDELRKKEETLRAKLAQPEPKPMAWGVQEGINLHDVFLFKDEAEEMCYLKGDHAKAIPLYTTPPQRDEPEPHGYLWFTQYMEQRFTHRKPEERERIGDVKPLYTAPPQREWQGLIMEEVQEILNDPRYQIKPLIVHAVEAKLKEKNGE